MNAEDIAYNKNIVDAVRQFERTGRLPDTNLPPVL